MTNPTWELVRIARTRAMADRLEQEAAERAIAAGNTEPNATYAYALGWLSHEAARRIVELEDAARAHGGSPAAPHTPLPEGAAGTPHLREVT